MSRMTTTQLKNQTLFQGKMKKMENKSLVAIINQTSAIEAQVIESEGVLSPELEQLLETLEIELADKIDGYHIVSQRLLSTAEMYKAIGNKYLKTAKTLENADDRLSERMIFAMQAKGVTQIQGNTVRFDLKPTVGSLVIDDEEMIPVEFKSEKTVTEINKKALKEAAAKGEVPGARVEPGFSLRKFISKKIGA